MCLSLSLKKCPLTATAPMPTFQRYTQVSYSTNEATDTMMIDPRIFMGILAKKLVRKMRTKPTTQPHTNCALGDLEPERVDVTQRLLTF
jgi:hypothetical protein